MDQKMVSLIIYFVSQAEPRKAARKKPNSRDIIQAARRQFVQTRSVSDSTSIGKKRNRDPELNDENGDSTP